MPPGLLYIFIPVAIVFVSMLLLVIYLYEKHSIPVHTVKAGPIQCSHALPNGTHGASISPFESFYHNGKKVNPKDYIVCKIEGDCMHPRGLDAGNLVFIKEFKTIQEKESIEQGELLYIKYSKDGYDGYKNREVDEKLNDRTIKTLYYSTEGNIKHSSNPHKFENIIGIVKMKFRG